MVRIERWITGAGKGVRLYAANRKMPAGMNTIEWLENTVEAAEISTAIEERRDVCRLGMVAPFKRQVPL